MNLESGVLQVHVEDIIPNRFQPRLNFDEQGLKELADSIREHGIIQPLVLRKLGDKYEIIAGERRYKAAQIVGLTTVPAVIANIDDNKSAEVALVENVQRRDLTAIEEARSYKNLLDKGYLTQEQLAKRMGLSQPAIANKLRLLNLDDEVQQALLEERISERHARTLLTIPDKNTQREWLHRVINERLTVRQLDLELKKIKTANETINTTEEESGGDVPLISARPSIADIKANAVDISQANKIPVAEPTEQLETLDILPTNNFNPTFNNPIVDNGNSFTTATTIPEFNIATPNSASTFASTDNFMGNNNEDNKFFGGNFDFNPTPNNANPLFTPTNTMSSNNGGLEIFDSPTSTNTFIEPKVEETPSFEPATMPAMDKTPELSNIDLGLSPNNKYFTPTAAPTQEVVIETKKEEVNPMDNVDKLNPDYQASQQVSGMVLKDAIAKIRSTVEDLGTKGFFIDVEEIDFDSNYQITMRIYKD